MESDFDPKRKLEPVKPPLGGTEQPYVHHDLQLREAWAVAINSYEEVPEIYRSFFDAQSPDALDPFPKTVITSSYRSFQRGEKIKLVCLLGDRLWILECRDGKLLTTSFERDQICYLETGEILLYSWMEIVGTTYEGALTRSLLKFNTVKEHLFDPFLRWIRPPVNPAGKSSLSEEQDKFDPLAGQSYKFRSFAKRSLLPGEAVIDYFFQPEIHKPILAFLGKEFSFTIANAHICILTDQELILIRDKKRQAYNKIRYGGIWDYVPLNKIKSVAVTEKNDSLRSLSILLPAGASLDFLYETANEKPLEALLEQLKTIRPAVSIENPAPAI